MGVRERERRVKIERVRERGGGEEAREKEEGE